MDRYDKRYAYHTVTIDLTLINGVHDLTLLVYGTVKVVNDVIEPLPNAAGAQSVINGQFYTTEYHEGYGTRSEARMKESSYEV